MPESAKLSVKVGVQVKRQLSGKKKQGTEREIPEPLKRIILANKWDQWEFEERELKGADLKSYLRLRQSLDAFGLIAVNFYLTGKTVGERAKRAEQVVSFVTAFMGDRFEAECDCPIGMYCCNGCCQSQPCGSL